MFQKPIWEQDEQVKMCNECHSEFSFWIRKHHCRQCGKIFCDDCSKQRVMLPNLGYTSAERVNKKKN